METMLQSGTVWMG